MPTMKPMLFLILLYAGASNGQHTFSDSIITQSSLVQSLLFLSQDSLKGRLTGSVGADEAAKFIAAKFDSIGLAAVSGNFGYFDHFTADYDGKKIPARNVMAMLPGKNNNDSLVIFSAHYDHIGQKDDMPYNKEYNYKDEIYNGANDNATGVAALLELARYYKAKTNNRYSIMFVAFSGEEMGMLGSTNLMSKMNPKIIKAVINLEMLGRPVGGKCFIASYRNRPIRNLLNEYLQKNYPGVDDKFFITDPYPDENLSSRSDHYPFARKIKNAFTIMGSSPADEYYHSVDDEYETIDFDFLWKATKNIALACEQFTR